MEIRRNYFTEEQERLGLLEEEIEQENRNMTEEKRIERDKIMQQRLEELYACIEKEQKKIKRIIDIKKLELFQKMSEGAVF